MPHHHDCTEIWNNFSTGKSKFKKHLKTKFNEKIPLSERGEREEDRVKRGLGGTNSATKAFLCTAVVYSDSRVTGARVWDRMRVQGKGI